MPAGYFDEEAAGRSCSNVDIFGVTGVEPALMGASTGGDVDRLKLDSIEGLAVCGGESSCPNLPPTGEADRPFVDTEEMEEFIVYCKTDSGDALLRLLSDLGGLAGDAPSELFEEAPACPIR